MSDRDMRVVNCPFCKGGNRWFYNIEELKDHYNNLHFVTHEWDERWKI